MSDKALVTGKYFRVYPITSIIVDRNTIGEPSTLVFTKPITEGLAIEMKSGDDDSYLVVAFVKPDHEGCPYLEDVGFRTVSLMEQNMSFIEFWSMMQEYKTSVEFARNALYDLHVNFKGND